ncbi:AraC family transcriptional regulator [Streptomyces sp. NBC_01803]|uniref:AraC family transcriptional regulator n=1 Tax=Streptomyces sp. NBC_01803 TaxID=2975946 RepID=UPI002DDB29C0|nr:AraC family transcriptional regulator [Streptomyces sp. NBC_01803]WSA45639.1 AraC family transcriptional regulator [Streptomyces sp. NBC_01803]
MDVLADALSVMRVGTSASARTEARAPWGLRFPAINGASFHVVLQGTCWLVPEGDREPLPLTSGDIVFLREGSAHGLADDPATQLADFAPSRQDPSSPIGQVTVDGPGARTMLLCGAYQLGNARPHPLLRELPEIVHLPARPGRHGALHSMIGLLGAELDERRPGRDGVVPALVDAMLLYILRAWVDDRAAEEARQRVADGRGPAGWAVALTDPAIGRALEGIHAEPARPWTVEELGTRGGLSRSVFAQRFTTLVGESPLAYLTWWRMTIAGRLLRESDAPLSTVAQTVGYSSEFAFAKAFKREYGLAPGRYRRGAAH